MLTIVGVDIAKESFTATLLSATGKKYRRQFSNSPAGHQAFLAWLKKHSQGSIHVCLEATSIYWEEVAERSHEAGYEVSVVNPARIKGYALSQLRRSKTDPLDADVIADFCRTQQPQLWQPPSEAERKLRALVRHREGLKKSRTQERNRLATCRDEEVQASLETVLATLEAEIQRVEERLDTFFDDHPDLKKKRDLLASIKGFGRKTATLLLAEMYDLERYESAKAAAADAGVTPSHFQSGTSVRRKPKMSRMGKASIRGALHFPAITAIRHNPVVRAFARRLQAKGKLKSVIRVAAMNKLMHLAYGVLKTGLPFDPNYGLAAV
jgi:transposase